MVTRRGMVGLIGGAGALGLAAPARAAPLAGWIETYLETARSRWRVPGCAVSVVQDGRLVFAGGFGQRDPARRLPATADTLFGIASLTKAFTAAGAAALVGAGRMAWDAPIRAVLPDFRMAGGPEYDTVSLRDMLSHRTGLPRHDLLWYSNRDLTPQEILRRLPYLETVAPVRARHLYNNLMYILAGHAAGRVADTSWEGLTRAAVLKPLGIDRAAFKPDAMRADRDHARPHRLNEARAPFEIPARPEDPIGAAGDLCLSAKDFAAWMRMQLGRGVIDGRRVLGAAEIEAMWAPTILTGGAPESPELIAPAYGLGWRIDAWRGRRRISHGGNLNGFAARITLLPEANIGVTVLTNLSASPLPGHATSDILDRMLDLEPRNWSDRALERRDRAEAAAGVAAGQATLAQVPGTTPSRALPAFAGPYSHAGYGDLAILEGPNGLRAVYNTMPMTLAHWHYDVFRAKNERPEDDDLNGLRFAFQSDMAGRVSGVLVEMEELAGPVLFARQVDPALRDPVRLAAFAGRYQMATEVVTVAPLAGGIGIAFGSGAAAALTPEIDGAFSVAGEPMLAVRFVEAGGRVTGLRLTRPSGVFEGSRIATP
jgi:CubicO group peptidase (beta-lactamase class C family)